LLACAGTRAAGADVYNLSTGREIKIRELAELINKRTEIRTCQLLAAPRVGPFDLSLRQSSERPANSSGLSRASNCGMAWRGRSSGLARTCVD
jgi:nucleoside-diphosphate-sugar epimerase